VCIASRRVRLPDLDERLRDRTPVLVEDATMQDDSLADRLAGVLARQVCVGFAERGVRKNGSGQFRPCLRNDDARMLRMTEMRAAIRLEEIWRMSTVRNRGIQTSHGIRHTEAPRPTRITISSSCLGASVSS
jgi:hypothetical protein